MKRNAQAHWQGTGKDGKGHGHQPGAGAALLERTAGCQIHQDRTQGQTLQQHLHHPGSKTAIEIEGGQNSLNPGGTHHP